MSLSWKNKSRVYIRNSIGDIGLPWGIPVSTTLNSSILLLKESRSCRSSRNERVQVISRVGILRSFMIASSLFFDTWSKAPFTSRNRAEVFLWSRHCRSTKFFRSITASTADFFFRPPICDWWSKCVVSARYPSRFASIRSLILPRQLSSEITLYAFGIE